MKGIDLAHKYYLEFGAPMIKKDFPEYESLIAIGLVGSGSECFGYDDDISTDHDFEPSFCMFIPGEDIISSKIEFALERAYAKLPKEFMGYTRCSIAPVGGSRHGVIRISDFYVNKIGRENSDLSINEWFSIPEYSLAEATNGEIFRDDDGTFSKIRKAISFYPKDVFLKKLAGNLLIMAQSGQYNYPRCISRGETGAAQLSAIEFVKSAMQTIFLLNGKYMPYYKWSFRALSELPILGSISYSLEFIISSDNSEENSRLKYDMIEDISALIIEELKTRSLTDGICSDLEKHAYSVNDRVSDNDIRNKNILFAI
jgi:hypothetical protein